MNYTNIGKIEAELSFLPNSYQKLSPPESTLFKQQLFEILIHSAPSVVSIFSWLKQLYWITQSTKKVIWNLYQNY